MPVPSRDSKKLNTLGRHLKRAPKTIPQIMKLMSISERSAYRWIRYLEEEGHDVVHRRDEEGVVRYSVLEPAKRKKKKA